MSQEINEKQITPEMQESNLLRVVKYTGFGESHEAEIIDKLRKGLKAFTVKHFDEFDGFQTEANLHFGKASNGIHYLNTYDFKILNQPENPILSKVEKIFVNGKRHSNTYTHKEIFNLRLGGSVDKHFVYDKLNKETGEIYAVDFTTWKKNNFQALDKYDNFIKESFNYKHLQQDLSKHSIVGIDQGWYFERLQNALQKGNSFMVKMRSGVTEINRYLVVNAQTQSIEVHRSDPRNYLNFVEMQETAKKNAQRQLEIKAIETIKTVPEKVLTTKQNNETAKGRTINPKASLPNGKMQKQNKVSNKRGVKKM